MGAPTIEQSPAQTAQPKGRIVAYDALRLFAILSVVAIHTLMPYRDVLPADAPIRVFDDVLHYAVPLFVFISGALVWARPWHHAPGVYRRFLARRFVLVGVPYLAWAALYAGLYVARAGDRGSALAKVPGLVASGHIWYLAAYVLRIVLGPPITHALSDVNPLLGQYGIHVLSHLPHMALGAWFALRLDTIGPRVRRWWPAMLLTGLAALAYLSASGTPAWPLELHRLLFPGAMALTVTGFALGAIALEPRYDRDAHAITHMGSLSFGVYFVHPLILLAVFTAAGPATAGSPWLRAWFPLLVWAGVSALSLLISDQLRRYRLTAWLVGLPPARRPTRR